MIQTKNLKKIYGKSTVKTHALKGISMEIPKGSFTCIVGPSGHGKSTLMHLLGGLDKATSGSIIIDGTNIASLNSSQLAKFRAKKIGFVFQFFNLLQNLTALENIETAMMFGEIPKKSQRGKAEELLKLVSLAEKANSKPNELSGGQQQRVSIARALANDPEILLMDEPTGNLDSNSEKEVLKHISKIHKAGKTIVIVTHNSEIAAQAEILFEVRDGKLLSYNNHCK
ncbi:MAG: ABC transporter ATP-binding protein [Pseudomonadales bacterium]|nr:ABC transporter ATP-binding protein [Pseudomonadales bacterium]